MNPKKKNELYRAGSRVGSLLYCSLGKITMFGSGMSCPAMPENKEDNKAKLPY